MTARPTESFKIVEKDIDITDSMIRVANVATPASLSVRKTPSVRHSTPGIHGSPQVQAVLSQPHGAAQAPTVQKPGLTKLVQKQKAGPPKDSNLVQTRNMIRTFRQHQVKLAEKQQELNIARKKMDIPAEKRQMFEEKYQECIKKGFKIKAKIFELEQKLQK